MRYLFLLIIAMIAIPLAYYYAPGRKYNWITINRPSYSVKIRHEIDNYNRETILKLKSVVQEKDIDKLYDDISNLTLCYPGISHQSSSRILYWYYTDSYGKKYKISVIIQIPYNEID